jgi:hypothetical protein
MFSNKQTALYKIIFFWSIKDIIDINHKIQKLLKKGADPNFTARYGKEPDYSYVTPLHIAALLRPAHIVRYLVEAGADVNACASSGSYDGCPPLYFAAHSLWNSSEKVEYLIDNGADAKNAIAKKAISDMGKRLEREKTAEEKWKRERKEKEAKQRAAYRPPTYDPMNRAQWMDAYGGVYCSNDCCESLRVSRARSAGSIGSGAACDMCKTPMEQRQLSFVPFNGINRHICDNCLKTVEGILSKSTTCNNCGKKVVLRY